MRPGVLLTSVLLLVSCKSATVRHGEVVLSGSPSRQVDQGAGQTELFFGPVHLSDQVRNAPSTVFLYLEGITIEPGSEAELYLVEPGLKIDPSNYIGSVATVVGNPSVLPYVVREVNDFEADGRQYKARTTLRGMTAVVLALVVKRGTVKVDRFILTTESLTKPREAVR